MIGPNSPRASTEHAMLVAASRSSRLMRAVRIPATKARSSDTAMAASAGPMTRADVAGIDRDAEREEEDGGERVPQRRDEVLDAARGGGPGEEEPGHERADRVGHAELEGDARDQHANPALRITSSVFAAVTTRPIHLPP